MDPATVHMTVYMYVCVCVHRYFGSAEGSKFVESASVNNVKRTWVSYGEQRDWTSPQQGQVRDNKSSYVKQCSRPLM